MGEVFDIIIVGAGLAGVTASYRVQTLLPGKSFVVLEAKERIGGTWDLFQYPGIRSDSDLTTYGFPFEPWTGEKQIASGQQILNYIRNTATKYEIDSKIRGNHRVLSANWTSKEDRWELSVLANGLEVVMYAKFVMWASGYYDHESALNPTIPGLTDFNGIVVHPQFWPKDLDYRDKRVVIIGSGATAATLVPAICELAGHVTMLQRSPSYFLPVPTIAAEDALLRQYLPAWISSRLIRWKYIFMPRLVMELCKLFPNIIRSAMRKLTSSFLPLHIPHDPHFEPKYNMGEQRICLTPDGEFFKALHTQKASIVTDDITTITASGVELKSGNRLPADIIVTATGLKIQLFGGSRIPVDGESIVLNEKYTWHGAMLQDVPNSTLLIGYTSTSWTLGTDIMSQLTIRLIKMMEQRGAKRITPRVDPSQPLNPAPLLDISATYVKAAADYTPQAGDRGPWRRRVGYYEDCLKVRFGNLTHELEFEG
ncbi:hypothetical protein H072_5848 [Dactylellina haptotyla CBS 200.50]|uniref:FAD/NAD(P)-binding domain-containing protein n=1 Tax=Dactylellina haptotyla (strain CBS 200.50) TaxID=1284197 RepID=S8AGU7_DACHA|nr:hypothetical protein H072_5848 [Dactylellina haptotyla CBS 200.50]